MKKLKLFVWETTLCDYTCGIMFALAEDVESARKLISGWTVNTDELYSEEPKVYTDPVGYAVEGGG